MTGNLNVSSWRHPGISRNDCALTFENQASEQSFRLDTANEEAQKTWHSLENIDLKA